MKSCEIQTKFFAYAKYKIGVRANWIPFSEATIACSKKEYMGKLHQRSDTF